MRLLELNSARDWNNILLQLPAPHLLQTYQWGQNKIQNGWTPLHYVWEEDGVVQAAALVLSRQVSLRLPGLRLEVLYCPKGPVLDWQNQGLAARVLDDLQTLAAQRRAPLVTDSPYFYIALAVMIIGSFLFLTGFLAELVNRRSADRNRYLIKETLNLSRL